MTLIFLIICYWMICESVTQKWTDQTNQRKRKTICSDFAVYYIDIDDQCGLLLCPQFINSGQKAVK